MTQILVMKFWLGFGSRILLGFSGWKWFLGTFGDNWRWNVVFRHQKFWFGFGTIKGDVTNFGVGLLQMLSQILVSQILIFQAQPRHKARRRTEPDQLVDVFSAAAKKTRRSAELIVSFARLYSICTGYCSSVLYRNLVAYTRWPGCMLGSPKYPGFDHF